MSRRNAKKRGPFRLLQSREVYKNPWIRVREDKVIRPDGKRGVFGVVDILPGVSIVAVDRRGYCYLTKEYHYGFENSIIEVVSGGIDDGETPLEAAKRELFEETGLQSDHWFFLGTFHPLTTVLNSAQYAFLALEAKKISDPSEEEKKLVKILRISFRKTILMVKKNRIVHAGSVIAILKADHFLRSKKYVFRKSKN